MKKPLLLLLTAALLLALCACGREETANPLITVPAEDDPLYLADCGVLHIEEGFVLRANFLVEEADGSYRSRTEGGIDLPERDGAPGTTGLTVGQLRTVLNGLLEAIPRQLEAHGGYLLYFVPLEGAAEGADYTWSLSAGTLTPGRAETVEERLGSFQITDGDPLARIWLAE